jgi:hypothetical protein
MNPRPTHKELSNKLRKAKELLEGGCIGILEPQVVLTDSFELGYSFQLEFKAIVEEILSLGGPNNYVGSRPPQRSYETQIKGAELFAFVVQSLLLDNKAVYFKFALYQDILVVISLHEDKKQEG